MTHCMGKLHKHKKVTRLVTFALKKFTFMESTTSFVKSIDLDPWFDAFRQQQEIL